MFTESEKSRMFFQSTSVPQCNAVPEAARGKAKATTAAVISLLCCSENGKAQTEDCAFVFCLSTSAVGSRLAAVALGKPCQLANSTLCFL